SRAPHQLVGARNARGALAGLTEQTFHSTDAADSGLSPLSGDQNQAETHATPEQTEVGTPPRAAANRPVRRERAGHRRHAGVVRTTDGDTGSANHPDDEADPGPCRQARDGFDEGRS